MTGTFEGIGSLQFTPDNKRAYAFSGEVLVNNTTVTMLEFETSSEYLISLLSYGIDQNASLGSSKLIGFTISFNDTKIFQQVSQTSTTLQLIDFDPNYTFVIPPFTKVKIETETTNTSDVPTYAMISAEVHGAIEQINLESITDDNKWAEKGPF